MIDEVTWMIQSLPQDLPSLQSLYLKPFALSGDYQDESDKKKNDNHQGNLSSQIDNQYVLEMKSMHMFINLIN